MLKATTEQYPSLEGVAPDAGYRKSTENFVINEFKKKISISKRIKTGWTFLAKRWIVEGTFAWFNLCRRLSKNYQMTTGSEAAFVMMAHWVLLLKTLA